MTRRRALRVTVALLVVVAGWLSWRAQASDVGKMSSPPVATAPTTAPTATQTATPPRDGEPALHALGTAYMTTFAAGNSPTGGEAWAEQWKADLRQVADEPLVQAILFTPLADIPTAPIVEVKVEEVHADGGGVVLVVLRDGTRARLRCEPVAGVVRVITETKAYYTPTP